MKPSLQERVDALAPWYHDIALADGVRTVGWQAIKHVWEQIRNVRRPIESKYADATVLDLGSWDGMWAFEAEDLGAKTVVAMESGVKHRLEHFLLCREARGSRALPIYGADAEHTDLFAAEFVKEFGRFDIVQHCGLLYHLKNPIQSLESCRRVMKPGGILLIETAGVNDPRAVMLSNRDSGVYTDAWTFWAPTIECLTYMLKVSGFEAEADSVSVLNDEVPRIAMRAIAI